MASGVRYDMYLSHVNAPLTLRLVKVGLHSRGVGGEPGNTDSPLTVVAGSLQATSPTVIQSEGGFCSLASSLVYHMVLEMCWIMLEIVPSEKWDDAWLSGDASS